MLPQGTLEFLKLYQEVPETIIARLFLTQVGSSQQYNNLLNAAYDQATLGGKGYSPFSPPGSYTYVLYIIDK